MTILKSLTLTALPQPGANPTLDRRGRVIARLEEQKRLLSDSSYTRTVRTTVRTDGERSTVEKQQRVLPWWRPVPDGTYAFFIRAGTRPGWIVQVQCFRALRHGGQRVSMGAGLLSWRRPRMRRIPA